MSLFGKLIAYYKMDESAASQNAADLFGVNDLVANNGTGGAVNIPSVAGKVGTARSLVAADQDYFSLSSSDVSFGDTDFSFQVWVKFDSISSSQPILVCGIDSVDYRLGLNVISGPLGSTNLTFLVNNGTSSGTATSSVSVSTGVWYHIVCWHDSVNNQVGICVNGTTNTTPHSLGVSSANTFFLVGREFSPSTGWVYLNATVDEIGVWKKVLSSDERSALYNSGSGLSYDSWDNNAFESDDFQQNAFQITGGSSSTEFGYVASGTLTTGNAAVVQPRYSITSSGRLDTSNGASFAVPVQNLSISNIHFGRIRLTWDAMPGGSFRYIVQRSTDGSNWTTMEPSQAQTTYENGGLASNTLYYYRVAAINQTGNETYPYSAAVNITTMVYTKSLPFTDTFNDSVIDTNKYIATGGTWTTNSGSGVVKQTSTANGDPRSLAVKNVQGLNTLYPDTDHQQITVKVRVDSWVDGDYARAGVGVRCNASSGAAYNLLFHNSHSTLQFLNDGISWNNSYTFNWSDDTWYWFKLKIIGNNLYGKVWAVGTDEPAGYAYTQTYTTRASGNVSCNGGSSGGGAFATASFDDILVEDASIEWLSHTGGGVKSLGGSADVQFTAESSFSAVAEGKMDITGSAVVQPTYLYNGSGVLTTGNATVVQPTYLYNGSGVLTTGNATVVQPTYLYIGTGVLTTSNAATVVPTRLYTGSGFATFSNSVVVQPMYLYNGSGVLTTSNAAVVQPTYLCIGSGVITTDNAATVVPTRLYTGTGILTFSNVAVVQPTYLYTGSGVLTASNAAVVQPTYLNNAVGLLTFSNAATVVPTRLYTGSGVLTIGGLADSTVNASSLTYTGTGLLTFSNAAVVQPTYLYTGSGVLTTSNSGVLQPTYPYTGSGVITTNNAAVVQPTYLYIGSGVLTTSNAATVVPTRLYTGTGLLTFSNAAVVQPTYLYTGSGVLTASNAAVVQPTYLNNAVGVLTFSNAAVVQPRYLYTGTGLLTFSNAAVVQPTYLYNGSGVLGVSNAASTEYRTAYTATGTLVFTNTANAQPTYLYSASGLLSVGGVVEANLGGTTATAVGGLAFSNTADVKPTYLHIGSGLMRAGDVSAVTVTVRHTGGGTLVTTNSASTAIALTAAASGLATFSNAAVVQPTYLYTGSGVVTTSNAATVVPTRLYTGSGLANITNTAVVRPTYLHVGSGVLTTSDAGVVQPKYLSVASGLLTIGNAATVLPTYLYVGSGVLATSNTATANISRFVTVASGVLAFSNTTTVKPTYLYTGSGVMGKSGTVDVFAGTNYSMTATGGMSAGGTSTVVATYLPTGGGVASITGTTVVVPRYLYTGSGSLSVAGNATQNFTTYFTTSGGLSVTGVLTRNLLFNYSASGKMVCGSTAAKTISFGAEAVGGLATGGLSSQTFTLLHSGSGLLSISEESLATMVLSYGGAGRLAVRVEFVPKLILGAEGSGGLTCGNTARLFALYLYTADGLIGVTGVSDAEVSNFFDFLAGGCLRSQGVAEEVVTLVWTGSGSLVSGGLGDYGVPYREYETSGKIGVGDTAFGYPRFDLVGGGLASIGHPDIKPFVWRKEIGFINPLSPPTTERTWSEYALNELKDSTPEPDPTPLSVVVPSEVAELPMGDNDLAANPVATTATATNPELQAKLDKLKKMTPAPNPTPREIVIPNQ